jgi:hypothetical protein
MDDKIRKSSFLTLLNIFPLSNNIYLIPVLTGERMLLRDFYLFKSQIKTCYPNYTLNISPDMICNMMMLCL